MPTRQMPTPPMPTPQPHTLQPAAPKLPRALPSPRARALAPRLAPLLAILVCLGAAAWPSQAVAADGVIDLGALSHAQSQDLRPLAPRAGAPFSIHFQAARGDLTSANVLRTESGSTQAFPASLVESRGLYDIWRADLPTPGASTLTYVIEAHDTGATAYLSAGNTVSTTPPTPAAGYGMDFTTISHAPLGATPTTGGVVFRVWAPNAATAHVRGQFNSWSLANPMTKGPDGVYTTFVPGASAGQMYKFFFNGSLWRSDSRSRDLVTTDNNNSRIFDPLAHAWQSPDFLPAPPVTWVVYQLHVHTFAGRNDPAGSFSRFSTYDDVAARADHLVELGINCVYLNPINEWPGDASGGYNPLTAWALESAQGDYAGFKRMVDALHARGIAVIVDLVWNHFDGATDLSNYDGTGVYLDAPAVTTPWGPQLDYDKPEVRRYFLDAAEMLLGECRVDGFRVDAVMAMTNSGWTPQWAAGRQILRDLNDLIDRRYEHCFTIAEVYDNSLFDVNPTSSGGLGFDAQYHANLRSALEDGVHNLVAGAAADAWRITDTIDGSGSQSSGLRAFNYFELHDEAWPLNGRERSPRDIDPTSPSDSPDARGLSLSANALAILARGVPAILMGAEWLEDDGWEFNKLDWSHKTRYPGVFRFYQDLIHLRTTKPSLSATSSHRNVQTNDGADVIAFERFGADGRSYIVVANLGATNFPSYLIGAPRAGTWGAVINSESPTYGGSGLGTPMGPAGNRQTQPMPRDGFPQLIDVALAPRSITIFQHNPEHIACPSDYTGDRTVDILDFLAFIDDYGACDGSAAPCGTLGNLDINADTSIDVLDFLDFIDAFGTGC